MRLKKKMPEEDAVINSIQKKMKKKEVKLSMSSDEYAIISSDSRVLGHRRRLIYARETAAVKDKGFMKNLRVCSFQKFENLHLSSSLTRNHNCNPAHY